MTDTSNESARGAADPSAARVHSLDGLRGIAIVLVVLGHTRVPYPDNPALDVPFLRGFFVGGTVTVFFVVGGFVVARNLLRLLDAGSMDPVVFYLRRLVRLGVQVVPLLAVLLLASALSPRDPYTDEQNLTSVIGVLTYTFNVTLVEQVLSARADLGHLWYLCVQQQVYLVLPFVLLLLHRRRRTLAVAMVVLAAAVIAHRLALSQDAEFDPAQLMTSTRSDGLFLGVALAAVEPWVRRSLRWRATLLHVSLLALAGLVLTAGELSEGPSKWWGIGTVVVAVLLIAGIISSAPTAFGNRLLAFGPLQWLGRASLVVYLWHYPILLDVPVLAPEWSGPARAVFMALLLGATTAFGVRYIDEPTRRFLRTSAWLSTRPPRIGTEPADLRREPSSRGAGS